MLSNEGFFFRNVDATPPPLVEILNRAIEVQASDLMVRRGIPIFYKVGGTWYHFSSELLGDAEGYLEELGELAGIPGLKERVLAEREVDFSFAIPNGYRFRINVALTSDGPLIMARLIRQEMPTLEDLGFVPESVRAIYEVLRRRRGMILVTGVTGSGKSTTLAAMINWLNLNTASNIVTIEDPIEFVFVPQKSAIHQREVGAHTHSFAKAIRAAMRQAPDVIMVGEMRDQETVKAALTAAETGHLVISTLHTKSAPETVSRIIDVLPAEDKPQAAQQLASSLAIVISQKLVPSASRSRRVMVYEMFVKTDAIRNLIAQRDPNLEPGIRDAIRSGGDKGMVLMEKRLAQLVKEGVILPETAYLAANSLDELKTQMGAQGLRLPEIPFERLEGAEGSHAFSTVSPKQDEGEEKRLQTPQRSRLFGG